MLLNAADNQLVRQELNPSNPDLAAKTWEFTDILIIANLFQFILVGQDTISSALTFVFYLLAVHNEVQEKCYNEIMKVVPDQEVTFYYCLFSYLFNIYCVFNCTVLC